MNLRFLNQTDMTSSASSFTATDIFNADYDIYLVNIEGFFTASSTGDIDLRLVTTGGSVITSTSYAYGLVDILPNSSLNAYYDTNNTHFDNMLGLAGVKPYVSSQSIWVFNPYDSSKYTSVISSSTATQSATVYRYRDGGGILLLENSIGGINIKTSSPDLGGGSIKTYGLRRD
tara:strand:+ start:507 stop:1028 length:522 start_codon:yes stop_codon:yes gene_type:complete